MLVLALFLNFSSAQCRSTLKITVTTLKSITLNLPHYRCIISEPSLNNGFKTQAFRIHQEGH